MRQAHRRTTFRARLAGAATLLCLVVLILAGAVVYWTARQALRAGMQASLLSAARAEVAPAQNSQGNLREVQAQEPLILVLKAGSGDEKFAQVENSADRIIARTENLQHLPPLPTNRKEEAQARAGRIVMGELQLHGAPLQTLYYPFRNARGDRLLAVVAIPEEPMRRALRTLLESICLSILIAGGVAATGAHALGRRLTVPLEQIAVVARTVGGTNLAERIPSFSPDAELQEVTQVLNEMLGRLEAAFLAQARFVADASHELRSPLSNLRGTVEVALRRPRSPDEYRQTLSTSLTEIERLSRLASDLLTLSRADTGRLVVDQGICDLGRVAGQAVSAHAMRAEEQQVLLHLDYQGTLPVRGDSDRLRQVLDNLLDNALRYAPAHSTVTVTAYESAGFCAVQVRDSGPGLSLQDQSRIFDRFYRADSSRARQSGGLGLGLAIAKAIAEAHGGRITVESRLAEGSVFALFIPSATSDSAAAV